jgi:hypothetical protein
MPSHLAGEVIEIDPTKIFPIFAIQVRLHDGHQVIPVSGEWQDKIEVGDEVAFELRADGSAGDIKVHKKGDQ